MINIFKMAVFLVITFYCGLVHAISLSPFVNDLKLPPKQFDARELDLSGAIRKQVTCGPCWAFSAAGVFELNYFLQTKEKIDISEQVIVDCFSSFGCRFSENVFKEMVENGKCILSEKEIPYLERNDTCLKAGRKSGDMALNYGELDAKFIQADLMLTKAGIFEMKRIIIKYGSVSTSLVSSPRFYNFYGESVFEDSLFSFGKYKSNHAVQIIGWDDNKQAWLIRNSWGEHWGNKGFAWVRYNHINIGARSFWIEAAPVPNIVEMIRPTDYLNNALTVLLWNTDHQLINAPLEITFNNTSTLLTIKDGVVVSDINLRLKKGNTNYALKGFIETAEFGRKNVKSNGSIMFASDSVNILDLQFLGNNKIFEVIELESLNFAKNNTDIENDAVQPTQDNNFKNFSNKKRRLKRLFKKK